MQQVYTLSMSQNLLSRLEYLDYLIRFKITGAPKLLAQKLQISERTLYEQIALLKSMGAPIKYSRLAATYYYKEEGFFSFRFKKSRVAQLNLKESMFM